MTYSAATVAALAGGFAGPRIREIGRAISAWWGSASIHPVGRAGLADGVVWPAYMSSPRCAYGADSCLLNEGQVRQDTNETSAISAVQGAKGHSSSVTTREQSVVALLSRSRGIESGLRRKSTTLAIREELKMTKRTSWAEPWKIKVVEPIRMTTREPSASAPSPMPASTRFCCDPRTSTSTCSPTPAPARCSDRQWAGMMLGDEAYAGLAQLLLISKRRSASTTATTYLIPTHQGRGAEHILSQLLIKPGDYVPGNMYFTTTRLHQELAGGTFDDVIIDEAHDPASEHPFKGNVDLAKLDALIARRSAPTRIPYVSVAATVNMAGGQPISMAQSPRGLVRYCTQQHGIRVMLDATRAVENAYFIQQREAGLRRQDRRRDPAARSAR